jgi:hypothetical protein
MLRSLLALALAVSGVGLAPATVTPGPVGPVVTSTAARATDAPAVEMTVEQTPLVVAPESEAATAGDAAATGDAAADATPAPSGAPTAPAPSTSAPTAPAPSSTPDGAASERVDPLDGSVVADVLTADGRVVTPSVETTDVQTIGVTWPVAADAAGLAPQARTLTDGEWSAWSQIVVEDTVPDAGTADALHAVRGGTDSFWVGDAEAVQLSFAATPEGGPAGLSLALVVEGTEPVGSGDGAVDPEVAGASSNSGDAVVRTAAYSSTSGAGSATAALPTAVPAPGIITRGQWGARPQICAPDVASALSGAVVHHTAGSNAYSTVAQAMAQIRGDQAYHIDARGWCDIGYNFLVDKWGNIYEGRANSLTKAVIGVHASGANTGTVGVSMLGNYDVVGTPPAMIDAVGRIIGYRLGVYGLNPQGSGTYPSGQTLPRVIAHRDVASTACPGRYGYAQMGNIRAIAAANLGAPGMPLATAQAVVKALYADLLGRGPDPTGLANWTTQLVGGTSQSELVASLTRSDEYISKRVRQAYVEVLGREPEPAGAANWLQSIRGGGAVVDDAQRRFYDSQEYFDLSGGTDAGYVQRLYQTVLGRPASAADLAVWVPRMTSPQVGRARVVDGIWFSVEAAQRRAGAYYQVFLRRGPDGPGLANWADVLLQHGEGAVRTGIAGSLEYQNLARSRFPA